MYSAKEFINSLMHVSVSGDVAETPAERHQRYLREQKLKGRKVGSSTPAPKLRPKDSVTRAPTPLPKKTPVDPAAKRAATEARIKGMQGRLEKLRELLKQLVEKAQERSGVEEPEETKPSKTAKSSDKKPLTEAEKTDAAKKAEEWREKNPDKVLDQKVQRIESQIKNVEEKISEMRKKLAESPVTLPRKTGSDNGRIQTLT